MSAFGTRSSRLALLANSVVLVGGGAAIAAAWGFQLIGGYSPCKLCLEQRIPYYIGLPLALVALAALLTRRHGAAALLLLLVAAVFAYGAGLGVYQAGAEWQFWAGPSDCGGGSGAPASAATMLHALQTTRVVSCTEASWRLLGLSFAGWNVVASGGVALLALAAALFARTARKGS
ncbi:disulfide bond formation protein B [Microvirga tunisiensis]|uniref:Disulfide bond formation protein B n=1 Tax=Pannonibacter tanglangensis TaxID=2750084 RepID=A0A7X5JBH2_9HYPH|nr:disulfide bond formation protein B [Pannonibacter sp. XCT-53]NBN80491.1 disulfide bond formation protein B [Pannonibacter sp. XCT-53]